MRIDENGNIEVECNEDYKKGIVNDYAFTSNPNQVIYTKDLRHCVGLGFVDEVESTKNRGLIHVHYNKEFTRDTNGNIILPLEKIVQTRKALENYLRGFKNSEKGILFENPKAIISYVRSLLIDRSTEKIKLRDELADKDKIAEFKIVEIPDKNRYENPMANFIREWLKEKGIPLYFSESSTNKKMPSILNMTEDPKETFCKEVALKNSKVAIGMYNRNGILLNRNCYEAELKPFEFSY